MRLDYIPYFKLDGHPVTEEEFFRAMEAGSVARWERGVELAPGERERMLRDPDRRLYMALFVAVTVMLLSGVVSVLTALTN